MAEEAGRRLRALYAPDGGATEVFTPRVGDYVAARPAYPPQVFAFFREVIGVQRGARVADVGAGTGLFTAGLLAHGYEVLAVEPNEGMREAADARFRDVPGYSSAAGSAEAIPVADQAVDFITAAQAFHWFDPQRARAEFVRVLRPHGLVALVWNDRLQTDPLHQALDEIFAAFGGERRNALVAHETKRDVPAFFGACPPAELRWPHAQKMDAAGLESLVFSRSYMPHRDSEAGSEVARKVGEVFRRFESRGSVAVRYTALAIVGRPELAR